jgi:hypothetical protein
VIPLGFFFARTIQTQPAQEIVRTQTNASVRIQAEYKTKNLQAFRLEGYLVIPLGLATLIPPQ